jgi:hypothetical protein
MSSPPYALPCHSCMALLPLGFWGFRRPGITPAPLFTVTSCLFLLFRLLVWLVLGFELRALLKLGKCPTTIPLALCTFSFSDRTSLFFFFFALASLGQ